MSEHPAAGILQQIMSDISERCWCAGWMMGTEHALWRAIQTPDEEPFDWGQDEVTPEERQQLRWLSEQCGGWWCNYDRFLPLDEWKEQADGE